MRRVEAVLFRPVVRQTAAAATVAAVLLAIGGPVWHYAQTRRAAALQAVATAAAMADLVRSVVVELPDLWGYATPKIARHLRRGADPAVVRIVVIDEAGRRLDVPSREGERSWPPVWWGSAPVYRGEHVVARVWVGIDATEPLVQVLLLALVSLALAAALSTALYVLPVRLVARAQDRIAVLLDNLEAARAELAALNEELEARVERRSRELAETAAALRLSEAGLREMAARAAEATEQERHRVARELHDGAGQILTGIRLSLQVLGAELEPGGATGLRLEEAERLVDEAIDEVRRIAVALRPPALDRLELGEALEELTRSIASRSGLEVEFVAPKRLERLPAAVETAAYRLVQEGLTNVVRHARASRARVEVAARADALEVTVGDDGQGFDHDAPRAGLGLEGMRERVALLRGTLSVEGGPGRGTRLRASLPLRGANQDGTAPGRPRRET